MNELLEAIARAVVEKEHGKGHWEGFDDFERSLYIEDARTSIRAYEKHRPRPAVVLTLQEWEDAQNAARRVHHTHGFEVKARVAFPWLKVEGDR